MRTVSVKKTFLSTLSLRRATTHHFAALYDILISIHALLAESDVKNSPALLSNDQFLSTLSLRRATFARQVQCIILRNFYPRSPCGERPPFLLCHDLARDISIHALLAESDVSRYMDLVAVYHNFYPRSPCRERHWQQCEGNSNEKLFLSTLSLRRATIYLSVVGYTYYISIHALLAESDSAHSTTSTPT